MSDLYLNESYYFEENASGNEVFALPFFNHFSLNQNMKKLAAMRIMRKKLNQFTLQLLIYYISEYEVLVRVQEKHLAMQLLWASAQLLVTRVSLST